MTLKKVEDIEQVQGTVPYNKRKNKPYNRPLFNKSTLTSIDKVEGETLETKISRLVTNKEPIKDGAPLIYTEKKDGVLAGYNIRTDRWEIATDAMDLIHKNEIAKSEGMHILPKDIDNDLDDGVQKIGGTE